MAYQSDTIASMVNQLNVTHFLPPFQRQFVWEPNKITKLFDSVMHGYPISTFLFWELPQRNWDNWEFYRFLWNAGDPDINNEVGRPAGFPRVMLVLDGQQRLDSFLIGLCGSYTFDPSTMKPPMPRGRGIRHLLYLNVLQDPLSVDYANADISYGFRFLDDVAARRQSDQVHWFPVAQILGCDTDDKFYKLKEREIDQLGAIKPEQRKLVDRNIDRLYRAIWKDQAISYYVERQPDYDRVFDIFVRVNQAGTKLDPSDMLLSMVTLRWEGLNAREEIYRFVRRLNRDLSHKNRLVMDFILKTCLVLTDSNVQYRPQSFSDETLQKIQRNWSAIKEATEKAVDLVNSFGIDYDTLTSANALIPIIYYLFNHPELVVNGTSQFDVSNTSAIRVWLTLALLNNAFSGQSDTLLRATRKALQNSTAGKDFPANDLTEALAQQRRIIRFNEAGLRRVLVMKHQGKGTFLALTLLHDDNDWGNRTYTVDHIFPQSLFAVKRMKAAGINLQQQQRFRALMNRLGNLQLLLADENAGKADQPIDKWLASRGKGYRQKHLIPDDDRLLLLPNFDKFIKARDDLIYARLKRLYSV